MQNNTKHFYGNLFCSAFQGQVLTVYKCDDIYQGTLAFKNPFNGSNESALFDSRNLYVSNLNPEKLVGNEVQIDVEKDSRGQKWATCIWKGQKPDEAYIQLHKKLIGN